VLADIETRVRAGRHGLAAEEPPAPGTAPVGPLMRRWLDGLENRNAKLDRQRAEKHLLLVWEKRTMGRARQLPGVMEWLDDGVARQPVQVQWSASREHLHALKSKA
jgi:hypothetical protein